jgi:hypothetical protein
MKTFQYKILRYLPDRIRGEFINVGVIVFDSTCGDIIGRFCNDSSRLSLLYPSVNGINYYLSAFNFQQQQFDNMKGSPVTLAQNKSRDLEAITNAILPKDDSALYFTETNLVLDTSIDIATEGLYDTIVHHSIIK